MAKGYPDFYGMQIFPKHGPVVDDTQSPLDIPNNVWTTIHEITGKGLIVGGSAWFLEDLIEIDTTFRLTLDDNVNTEVSVLNMVDYAMDSPLDAPIFLQHYEGYEGQIKIGYAPGITFDINYKIEAYITNPGDTVAHSVLHYTRIL